MQMVILVNSKMEKAEVLGNFISRVFTVEEEQSSSSLPLKHCHFPMNQLVFNEQIILDK